MNKHINVDGYCQFDKKQIENSKWYLSPYSVILGEPIEASEGAKLTSEWLRNIIRKCSENSHNCETCKFELYCPEMCEGCCEWDSHYEPKDEPQTERNK